MSQLNTFFAELDALESAYTKSKTSLTIGNRSVLMHILILWGSPYLLLVLFTVSYTILLVIDTTNVISDEKKRTQH